MTQITLAAAIAAWGLLCFGLGRWCRSLAFVLVAAAPALGIVPVETVCRERCDLIERNHFYDEQGRLVFEQIIFSDWCAHKERFIVRAWRLVKNPSQIPERDWERGGYVTCWLDGEITREVKAVHYRESWTQYDPELYEREILCKERRRELSHPTAARPR